MGSNRDIYEQTIMALRWKAYDQLWISYDRLWLIFKGTPETYHIYYR